MLTRHAWWAWTLAAGLALPPTVSAQSLREVFRRVSPSVVVVYAEQRLATPLGSPGPVQASTPPPLSQGAGVLVSPDGKVLTAAHVVWSAVRIEVEFVTGQRLPARVVTAVPFADLALLQLPAVPPGIPSATIGDSNTLEVGDQIFAVGGPRGLNHSLAVGWVGARRGPEKAFEGLTALELIQIDAAIYEGNSGGPIFDVEGRVVGIVSHVLVSPGAGNGPGFAVASNVARRLLDSGAAWFGVETYLIEGAMAGLFNVPQPAGLLVQSVAADSLASQLGLRGGSATVVVEGQPLIAGGDIILRLFGQDIQTSPESLAAIERALDGLQPGDRMEARVLRAGQVLELAMQIPIAR